VVAFIPMKMTNERLPGKNDKLIGGDTPLYHLITSALLKTESVDEVFIYCSEPALSDLPKGVTYMQRPRDLDLPTTSIAEIMDSFAADVPSDIYLMAHATAPFLSPESLDRIVRAVLHEGHDSALAVSILQDFLWKSGKPFNYDMTHIPRTQDLEQLLSETTGAYAYTADVLSRGRRVGDNPAPIPVSKLEAIDINDEEDWVIADAIYRHLWNSGSQSLGNPLRRL